MPQTDMDMKEKNPEISVVLCAYNAENYIVKAVDSVLNQTYPDFELIIVDDGSTDGTAALVNDFAEKDGRIRVIRKENGGLSSARNMGTDIAAGEFITYIDSDDFVDGRALEEMRADAVRTGADIVICGYYIDSVSGSGIVSSRKNSQKEQYFTDREEILKRFAELKSSYILDPSWNKLYRASVIKNNGIIMPEGEMFEDTEFILRLLGVTSNVYLSDKAFYHYVQRKGSLTKKYSEQKLDDLKKRYKTLCGYVKGADKSLKLDGFCDLFYIKSVYSYLFDLFLTDKTKEEIKSIIKKETETEIFRKCAFNALACGLVNRKTINAAKSGSLTVNYRFCRNASFIKYRLGRLFNSLKRI